MPQTRIFLSGDSSTYGYGDPERGGWGTRLKNRMMDRAANGEVPAREVLNCAISSQSLPQIVERFPGQVANFPRFPAIGIFMLGAIESDVRRGHDRPRVELPDFSRSLRTLTGICIRHTISPIFVGYHEVDEDRTNPWQNGDRFTVDAIRTYNAAMREFATHNGIAYVSLDSFNQQPDINLAPDGLHPSPRGAQLICDTIELAINAVLRLQQG